VKNITLSLCCFVVLRFVVTYRGLIKGQFGLHYFHEGMEVTSTQSTWNVMPFRPDSHESKAELKAGEIQ
jgi:hypothetical protein